MYFNFVQKPNNWHTRAWRVALRITSGKFLTNVVPAMLLVLVWFGFSNNAWAVPAVANASATVSANTSNNSIDLVASITGITTPFTGITVGTATNGTVTGNTTGATTVTYTPNADFSGADSFTYTATDSNGTSASATVNVTVNPVAPGAPTIGTATLVTTQATVTFTAPTLTGGANITGYTVISSPAGGKDSNAGTTSLSHIVTGLANGTTYTFTVTATNSAGTSSPSAASNSVTTATTVPGAPSIKAVTAGNNSATVTITAPTNNGGSAITGYTVNCGAGTDGNAGTTGLSHSVTGLTNGTLYSCMVTATNAIGTSKASSNKIVTPFTGTTASNTSMSALPNTPTSIDLTSFITGTTSSTVSFGVSISSYPAHGTVAVFGTKVTYTSNADYSGTDSFMYLAYGVGGVSPIAATVTITITGRVDPTKDARVTGLVNTQTAAVTHFSTAQLLNFQQRMESRHHAMNNTSPTAALTDSGNSPPSSGGASVPLGTAPAFFGSGSSGQSVGTFNSWQPNTMLAYANDPNAMLHAPDRLSNGQPAATDMVSTLMSLVTGLAINSSLNLGTISNAVGAKQDDEFGRLDLWAAGSLRFGTSTQGGTNTQFSTDGISVGVDKRLNRNLTVGMGVGYARDNSTVGTDGTNNKARGDSLAVYASYMKDSGTFIDGLLGYGKVTFDTNRYVTAASNFARASRKGSQLFGSLSLGYESHRDALLWSPYGRYDFSYDRLNEDTETGADALNTSSQKVHSANFALGLRGQSAHQTEYGVVQPRARIEYQHGLEKIGQASVAYADLPATQYSVAGTSQNTHSVLIGLGSDFLVSNTLKFGIDYQHLGSNGAENYQSISFLLTKTLQGKNDLQSLFEESESSAAIKPTGIIVEAGYAFDSNVTRGSDASDMLSDSIYSLMLSKSKSVVLSKRHRLTVTGFLDTEMFRTYTGLDHFMGGLQGEYAYRNSGEFGSPTYAIFTRFTEDKFNSELRSGTRRSAGVSIRDELTNAINIYSALSANARTGKSEVFNTRDQSARVNLDYELDQDKTLYLTGEYQRGDFVSSGLPSNQLLDISNWINTKDDVFNAQGFNDYRFKGHSGLWTLGYNVSFGSKDSFDLSWRHTKTTPDLKPTTGLPENYIDNLYSINYLMSF